MATAIASTAAARVCVVIGLGSGGIGNHVAHRFAQGGYRTILLARRLENLQLLEQEIPHSRALACDVTDFEQVQQVISIIQQDYQKIDAIIYNAGSGSFKTTEHTSVEDFEMSLRTGPLGLFTFAKYARPLMGKGSAIGVTGATASWRGMPFTPAFASSKFATRGLTQALARDWGPNYGIHVFHVVIDGVVRRPDSATSMSNKPVEEFLDPKQIAETFWILAQQPPGCWTQEIHVGAGAAFGSIVSI